MDHSLPILSKSNKPTQDSIFLPNDHFKYIKIPDNHNSPKSNLKHTLKGIKSEASEANSSLYYFPHQTLKSFQKERNTELKSNEYESWRNTELKKIQEARSPKELTNLKLQNDKMKRKQYSIDNGNVLKSALRNVSFSKLSRTRLEMLPKPSISDEDLKENLKKYIGVDKYPIEYQELKFDVPKTNFIRFSSVKSGEQNPNPKKNFEEHLLSQFHNSQTSFHSKTIPRRDMLGLAQWLDKASEEIFSLENLSPQEQLLNIQKVYTVCITEIVEIISKECMERGAILSGIWNVHTTLVNACLSSLEKEKNRNYSNFLDEIEKIKASYVSCFDQLIKENKEKNTLLEDRDLLIKKLSHDNGNLKRKEHRLEKTVTSLGNGIKEMKEMLDVTLAENIKMKLSKEEEGSLRKGERTLLKKQYDNLTKHQQKDRNQIKEHIEKLLLTSQNSINMSLSPPKESFNRRQTSFNRESDDSWKDQRSANDQKYGNSKKFSFVIDEESSHKDLASVSVGTLNNIKEEKNSSDDDFEGVDGLFVKEIGVDTKDLLPVNNQATTTTDLAKYFSKEDAAQTVFVDEILFDNDDDIEHERSNSLVNSEASLTNSAKLRRMRSSLKSDGDQVMETMMESIKKRNNPAEKQRTIHKRMCSFSEEPTKHFEKLKEIQSYTLTGTCEWYSQEMEVFFKEIRCLIENSENSEKEDYLEYLEHYDWLHLTTMFQNISMIHEQFILNIKHRDNTRSKEILQHRIELLEKTIEMDETDKMRDLFRKNYNKLREKFEQFYQMTIRIQSKDEEEETQKSQNLSVKLKDLNIKRKISMVVWKTEENENQNETEVKHEDQEQSTRLIEEKKPTMNTPVIMIMNNEEKNESIEIDHSPDFMNKSQKLIAKFDDALLDQKIKSNLTISTTKTPTKNIESTKQERKTPTIGTSTLSPSKMIHIAKSYNELAILENETSSVSKQQNNVKLNVNSLNMNQSTLNIEPRKSEKQKSTAGDTMIRYSSMKKPNNESQNELSPKRRGKSFKEKMTPLDIMSASTRKNNNIQQYNSNAEIEDILQNIDKEKKEVMQLEERAIKEQNSLKDMISNEKMIDMINQAHNVLPQKKTWDKINSPNADKCYAFLHRIEASEILPSKKVTLVTVLKTISQVYTELIKLRAKKQGNLNPLFFILYEFLMQRYGNNRERTEEKMLKLMQGCKAHLELPKIRNFARLLNILQSKVDHQKDNNGSNLNYDGNDLVFFLTFFMQMDDNPMSNIPGIMLSMSTQEKSITALGKAIEVVHKFCGGYSQIFSKTRTEAVLNQIKATKMDDPIVSRKYVVDVDFVMERLFEIREETFKIFKAPFLAVDIDHNEVLNLNEFLLLLRNLERGRFSEKDTEQMFLNEYDFFDEEKQEKCMSFKRFAFLCEREGIMTIKTQDYFAQNITDEVKNVRQLKDDWDVKKNLIKLKLIKTNYYSSFYVKALKVIEACLSTSNINEEESKVNWMRYRIMDEESNAFLLQFEADSCLPKEINLINLKAGELF